MSGSIENESNVSDAELRAHVHAAQSFMGTGAEYCRRNGINGKQFYAMQEKLGLSRNKPARKPAKAFVKVQAEAKPLSDARPLTRTQPLPDAKWVAELVLAVLAQR